MAKRATVLEIRDFRVLLEALFLTVKCIVSDVCRNEEITILIATVKNHNINEQCLHIRPSTRRDVLTDPRIYGDINENYRVENIQNIYVHKIDKKDA